MNHQPIVILISGAPGTGKSTLGQHAPYYLRPRLGETAVLSADEFYRMFDPQWQANNRGWWQMAAQCCLHLTQYLLRQGVQVVLIEGNGLYTAESVIEVLHGVGARAAVYHFTLDAHIDAVTERVRQRGDLDMHPPQWLADWLAHIRSHYISWTHVIDTTGLTPEATLEIIVQHIEKGPPLSVDVVMRAE
ncbi:MAG: hypothetical protein R3A44_14850 [Caldilineaceae bacterium]